MPTYPANPTFPASPTYPVSPVYTTATVYVNASSPVTAIPAGAFAVGLEGYDNYVGAASGNTAAILADLGVTGGRVPGGNNGDRYHDGNGIAGDPSGPSNTSGLSGSVGNTYSISAALGKLPANSKAAVMVNYGSNAAGNAGGDTTEAATLAGRVAGLGFSGTWYEIGNEQYANVYKTDLHADKSAAGYVANAPAFISAVKGSDATGKVAIPVGMSGSTFPFNYFGSTLNGWNAAVLTGLGSQIDGVVVHWYPQVTGQESDYTLLHDSVNMIRRVAATIRNEMSTYVPGGGANIKFLVTEMNAVGFTPPGTQQVSHINALFLVDAYLTWLEQGAAMVSWHALRVPVIYTATTNPSPAPNNSASLYGWDTHNYGSYGLVSYGLNDGAGVTEPPAQTPYPTYYGFKLMARYAVSASGTNTLVSATSSNADVGVHAITRGDGLLSVVLVNRVNQAQVVQVALSGYTPSGTGTQSQIRPQDTDKVGAGRIDQQAVGGLSPSFSVALPAWTALVLTL